MGGECWTESTTSDNVEVFARKKHRGDTTNQWFDNENRCPLNTQQQGLFFGDVLMKPRSQGGMGRPVVVNPPCPWEGREGGSASHPPQHSCKENSFGAEAHPEIRKAWWGPTPPPHHLEGFGDSHTALAFHQNPPKTSNPPRGPAKKRCLLNIHLNYHFFIPPFCN